MSNIVSIRSAVIPDGNSELKSQLLGTLLANLEGMVYRCRPDQHWTMEFVSDGCAALTGYRSEDILLNSRISYDEITHPDEREYVRQTIGEAVTQKRRFDLEYRINRADGQVRWVLERGMGIFNANGQLLALEGFIQDITQRVEAERRYRSIFENAVEGMFQSTRDNGYMAVNPALVRMYGYDSAEELMSNLRNIERQVYVDPRRRAEFVEIMEKTGTVSGFESRVYKRDGQIIWISENVRAVRNSDGEVLFYEGSIEDITIRKWHESEIRHQATHDALTGLPNRVLLNDRVKNAMQHARRTETLAAIVFVDLDQFKFINDSLGHHIGDQLLKIIAERLSACLRDSDTVARLGGDEFVLVLENQADLGMLTQTMQRIMNTVAQPWHTNGLESQITCSMGLSLYPDDGSDVETLLRNADSAMYKAKEMGRNNFQFYAAEMNTAAARRMELLSHLRRAISNDEFLLYYQPKLNLSNGRLIGMEALIRWQSSENGFVSPADFIPLAEETGLILPIGEWVLQTACAQNAMWQRAGHPAIPVSVNLSPRQLERGNVVELVSRILKNTGLDPQYLELEITEGMVMQDVEKSLTTLIKLKQLGIRISIDDFGTGHSSLSYLKRFPVDTLKIDQSFVRDIEVDAGNAAIVKAIISLGHILNLNVLAEGVETPTQRDFLLEYGCDEVQGYLFAKPLSAIDFVQALHWDQ